MKDRRDDCFLTTKCHVRDHNGAAQTIDESLKRLQTDHVDLLLFHHVQSLEEYEIIFSSGGAAEAFLDAQQKGKTRYIGISGHGIPDVLIHAVKERADLDAVMTSFNFFDRFNFPEAETVLIEEAKKKGVGIIGMKALADGLLWEYPETAIRYTLSLPVDVLPLGMNTLKMLETDFAIADNFTPLSETEKEELFTSNPVLGSYVCRQCGKCLPCPEGIDIPKLFTYEGWYDRQMRDWTIRDMPEFALRDRLRFWYGNLKTAREQYAGVEADAQECTGCGECIPRCPYGIDIIRKLENTHYKLTVEEEIPILM
jgi:predicted aldo/keto reductase-like oxidoreductase